MLVPTDRTLSKTRQDNADSPGLSPLTTAAFHLLLPLPLLFSHYREYMLNYLARSTRPSILHPGSFKSFSSSTVGNMSKTSTPLFYHADPEDSWHGKIDESNDSPFKAEKDRYHMYIGLFCPFAHRANIVRHLKGLQDIIDISITKPYPKGDENGWPGWQFPKDDHEYPDATVDKLFGSKYLHEIYFKADKDYKGRYSVPALWDKKTSTLVNNVSESRLV